MTHDKSSNAFQIILWVCILGGAFWSGTANLLQNHDGQIVTHQCAVVEGSSHIDPRNGDGPECDAYKNVTISQSPVRSFVAGLPEGIVFGVMAGFAANWAYDKLPDEYKAYRQKIQ